MRRFLCNLVLLVSSGGWEGAGGSLSGGTTGQRGALPEMGPAGVAAARRLGHVGGS